MSASPVHYNEVEDAFITDANFKVDISQKMKVPNKISFNPDANGVTNWNDNINMQVPERILVVGQHQHIGEKLYNSYPCAINNKYLIVKH